MVKVLILSFYSDGSLSTKQILFLQRPILQRKRKDFKVCSLVFNLCCTFVTFLCCAFRIRGFMSQKVSFKSHIAKLGRRTNEKYLIIGRESTWNRTGKTYQWCCFVRVCQVSGEMERNWHKEQKRVSQTSLWFQMLYLKGRSKAKKPGTQEELENMSPLMETEMTRLSRNTGEEGEEGEEAEGRKSVHKESGQLARLRESKEDAWHQKKLLSGSRESVEEQEEETDVDEFPLQMSVRWTDVCQRDCGGGGKEEAKTEERIRQQLFSGVCWHKQARQRKLP